MKRSPRLHVYRRHGEPREPRPPDPLFPEYPRLEPSGDVTVLVRADGSEWTITQRVPATRAQCPSGARCGAVRCRYHLARVDSQDRPGRPGLRHVKRDALGKIQRELGHAGDERAATTIDPWWTRDEPPPPSLCALDYADRGPQSNSEIGAVMQKHRTLIGQLVRRALHAFIAVGGDPQGLRSLSFSSERERFETGNCVTSVRIGGKK